MTERFTDFGRDPVTVARRLLGRARRARVERGTNETKVSVAVDLDADGPVSAQTGIGFYDHMLEQVGKHAGIALEVRCEGDLEVDQHHTVEDVALTLGQALREALGAKRGIGRYGFVLPMDESQARVAIDLSGLWAFLPVKEGMLIGGAGVTLFLAALSWTVAGPRPWC